MVETKEYKAVFGRYSSIFLDFFGFFSILGDIFEILRDRRENFIEFYLWRTGYFIS